MYIRPNLSQYKNCNIHNRYDIRSTHYTDKFDCDNISVNINFKLYLLK